MAAALAEPRGKGWERRLREGDPGLLRLVQAAKTVVAVVVVLGIFWRAGVQTRMVAAVGAAFVIQCASTGTRRRQQWTMVVTGVAMTGLVGLGAMSAGHPSGRAALLVLLAPAAFYARRFLPDQGMFPVFGFTLTLLTTAMAGGWGHARGQMIGLAAALGVAFVVYFYVWPADPWRGFVDELRMFGEDGVEFLTVLAGVVRGAAYDGVRMRGMRRGMREGVAANQKFVDQWPPGRGRVGKHAGAVLMGQYEALLALDMMDGAVRELAEDRARTTDKGECAGVLPAQLPALLSEVVEAGAKRFQELARQFRAKRPGTRGVPAMGVGEELGRLQEAVVASRHPLCPEMAHLFTAVVAGRQLGRAQGEMVMGEGKEREEDMGGSPMPREGSPETRWTEGLRVPVRAAVAVGIALGIGAAFQLQRSYWAVLVAVLLVSGTWGENTRKGLQRFGMTVAGCVAGWAVHWAIAGDRSAEVGVMVAAIFLAAYYRTTSYPRMTFFVTVYVVFLFALLGQASGRLLWVRVYETFVGCGVALAASVIVAASRSTAEWEKRLRELQGSCRRVAEEAFARVLGEDGAGGGHAASELLSQLHELRVRHRAATYEGFFAGASRRRREETMGRVRLLAHDCLSLAGALESPHRKEAVDAMRGELRALRDLVVGGFEAGPAEESEAQAVGSEARRDGGMDEVQERLREKVMAQQQQAGGLSRGDAGWVGPVVYYAREIRRICAEVAET